MKYSIEQRIAHHKAIYENEKNSKYPDTRKLNYSWGFIAGSGKNSRQNMYNDYKADLEITKQSLAGCKNERDRKELDDRVSFCKGYIAGYRTKCIKYKRG